jgi:hypothetical protein
MPFPIRQQISNLVTGTSLSGVLRVAPTQNNLIYVTVSAATVLTNLTGPAGYTKAAEEEGDGVSIQFYYKRAGASESATITVSSSVSVALKIHVFESPAELYIVGDPLDVTDTNDSSTSAVTTLSAGTTATVSQANTFAIAAVAALAGNADLLLVNWSDSYTALSDHETRGLMVGYKIMTATTAATAIATWNQPTTPTSHKAAGLIVTFKLASPVILPTPTPRRVAFGSRRAVLNTTGTIDTIGSFSLMEGHAYLAFVGTSKTGGNDGDTVIPNSHNGQVWTLHESHSIGSARRVHILRTLAQSDKTAGSVNVTTPETSCAVWWIILDLAGVNQSAPIRQVATGDESVGATSLEVSFPVVPLTSNGTVGICLHGTAERQLIDDNPIHLLYGESDVGAGQQATLDWYQGSDQTSRWEWASSIHAIAIIAEIQAAAADNDSGGDVSDSNRMGDTGAIRRGVSIRGAP